MGETLRRLGQALGLIYRDDGSWGVGGRNFRRVPGMRPPPTAASPDGSRRESPSQ